jgi:hypothetical protein
MFQNQPNEAIGRCLADARAQAYPVNTSVCTLAALADMLALSGSQPAKLASARIDLAFWVAKGSSTDCIVT